jgi:hypothetical protein
MQSSAMMALRGMILLVCLAIVPALALLNNGARDRGLAWLKRWFESPSQTTTSVATSLDAPIFRPAVIDHTAESDSLPSAKSASPTVTAGAAGNDVATPRPLAGQPQTVPLIGQRAVNNPQQPLPNGGDPLAVSPITMVSHEADIAAIGPQMATSQPPTTPSSGAAPQFPPDYFRSTELKLRSLGAAYYLLEFGATAANEYRFLCKMPAANNPEETLVFFANNADPRVAMESVVRQIEGWQGSLQPPIRR